MTRDEGVARIKEQLAFRTTLDTAIVNQMILVQTLLERAVIKPWFLVSEDAYVTTVPGEQRLGLPPDFLGETDQAVFRYVPTNVSSDNPEVDLIKDEYDVLRKNYFDTDTGTTQVGAPKAYARIGNYFRLFPIPDAIYTLHMIYYAADTTFSTNVENKWLKHAPLLILGKAGKLISGGPLRDPTAYSMFSEWEKEGMVVLHSVGSNEELVNRSLQIGGPH